MVSFVGICTRCHQSRDWPELSQNLACLDAKNRGGFGQCVSGVMVEHHDFDQECDTCAEEDEGIGDLEVERKKDKTAPSGKRRAEGGTAEDERKKQKT